MKNRPTVATLLTMILVLACLGQLSCPQTGVASDTNSVAGLIEAKLAHLEGPKRLWVSCEHIHAGKPLLQFYRERNYAPFWVTDDGLTALAQNLPEHLLAMRNYGYRPEDYHLNCMLSLIRAVAAGPVDDVVNQKDQLADLDILMTDAFVIWASHLANGKVDPEHLYAQWIAQKSKLDLLDTLHRLAQVKDLDQMERELSPPHPGYWSLANGAQKLRKIVGAGGWPVIENVRRLKLGDQGPEVTVLRHRLGISGDLSEGNMDNPAFDTDLEEAVKRFQERHGLETDGVVGPKTLAALNVPAQVRLEQVLINMERWRWLPRNLGNRYIVVNIAAFSLGAYDGGDKVLSMRVIVGKDYRKSPVFSERMRYLVINPYWNVPYSIATKEILPFIKKNPRYLAENHFELVTGWGATSTVLDPMKIHWRKITPRTFPGRLRQTPGPWNALGRIKFMFPNRFNVYLHDTPYRNLFDFPDRALSHGCIRVQKPLDLAMFVLENDPQWTREKLEAVIAEGNRQIVGVPGTILVHLLYWSAWANADGSLNFRPDIYDRDAVLAQALLTEPADDTPRRQAGATQPRAKAAAGTGRTYQ